MMMMIMIMVVMVMIMMINATNWMRVLKSACFLGGIEEVGEAH